VGAKIVWHCDGNYRPLLDDVLACGVGGLQGFQTECGMDLAWIRDLHTRQDEPLLIFGPLSVTTTLPHGSPADVRAEVHKAMTLARDHVSLVFFTSNTITPDIPLENVRTFWQTVQDSRW
jgi:uroporphyrinogen decarboxylase